MGSSLYTCVNVCGTRAPKEDFRMSHPMTKVFDQLRAGMTQDKRGMDREMDSLEMISEL